MSDVEELNASKLGTKKYWDDFYNLEKSNYSENPEDSGECWFSDSGAEEKMVDFLVQEEEEGQGESLISLDCQMCDLGTGNGRLLFSIREAGFTGVLTGLDYSQPAVEFSAKIAEQEEVEEVVFEHADFLGDADKWSTGSRQWDVVLDKGTLDAIALSDIDYDGNTGVQKYPLVVQHMVKSGGIVLVTSCNFTPEELVKIMTTNTCLKRWKDIKYPSFRFGGTDGSTVCSIAFKKD